MLSFNHIFTSFSVDNLDKATQFYSEVIGLKTERTDMGLSLFYNGEGRGFVYEKQNHRPASFTVLNFVVSDIDAAIDQLKHHGVQLEYYQGLTNESRIHRGIASKAGPDIAWFKDPAGNILSVLQEK